MVRVALIGLLLLSPAVKTGAVYGPGTESCRDWMSARTAVHPPQASSAASAIYEYWILGYMTGFAAWGPGRSTDVEAMFEFVDKYCTRNPADRIDDAAADLAVTLFGKGFGLPVRRW